MEEKKEIIDHSEKIARLKAAGYIIGEFEEDECDFEETENLAKQETKEEIEEKFDAIVRKHMKATGLSDAVIEKWEKERIIDYDL